MPRARSSRNAAVASRSKKSTAKQTMSIAAIRMEIKQQLAELLKHFTQVEIAQQLRLHQPQVSLLWNGKPVFSDESRYSMVLEALRLLRTPPNYDKSDVEVEQSEVQEINEQLIAPSYTKWLTEEMATRGINATKLSEASRVTLPVLNRILAGNTSNPQQATRKRLERALNNIIQTDPDTDGDGVKFVTSTYEDRLYVGFPFVESEIDQAPSDIGVYVIHDRRGFPMYIGSGSIRDRLKYHHKLADFARRKNASKFSYYVVPSEVIDGVKLTRKQLTKQALEMERVLIKFSGNAVSHNTQHRTDLSDW